MKILQAKLLLLFLGMASLTNLNLKAQSEGGDEVDTNLMDEGPVYQKGDLMLNAGISFGLIGYGYGFYGSRSFSVPITANVAYGITEEVSVGGYLGYYGVGYGPSGNRYQLTNYSFGVQGTFHATPFLNEVLDLDADEKKIDYYGKLLVGFETFSWKYNGRSFDDRYDTQSSRAIFGPVIGVRYMFKPNIGAYIEGGRGAYGLLTIGASFKL